MPESWRSAIDSRPHYARGTHQHAIMQQQKRLFDWGRRPRLRRSGTRQNSRTLFNVNHAQRKDATGVAAETNGRGLPGDDGGNSLRLCARILFSEKRVPAEGPVDGKNGHGLRRPRGRRNDGKIAFATVPRCLRAKSWRQRNWTEKWRTEKCARACVEGHPDFAITADESIRSIQVIRPRITCFSLFPHLSFFWLRLRPDCAERSAAPFGTIPMIPTDRPLASSAMASSGDGRAAATRAVRATRSCPNRSWPRLQEPEYRAAPPGCFFVPRPDRTRPPRPSPFS